jgi:hypothetical protein
MEVFVYFVLLLGKVDFRERFKSTSNLILQKGGGKTFEFPE